MIVDCSAIIAILYQEPGWRLMIDALLRTSARAISAPTFVEAGMVIEAKRGHVGATLLDRLVERFRIEVLPFDRAQAEIARAAFRRFVRDAIRRI